MRATVEVTPQEVPGRQPAAMGMLQHAGRLGCEATEVLFNAASSTAARKGQSIQRYYRDCAMYRSHISSQCLNFAAPIARSHFGLKVDLFGL